MVEYYRDLAADPVVLKHEAPIRLARWRHDGAQALALTDPTNAPDRPATVHIWQIASAANQAPVSVAQISATRESPILDAFFAPSGTTIATLHSDSIRLWDVPSRKVVASLKTAKFADLLSTPPNRRDSPFAASGEWLLTLTSGGQLRRSWIDPLRGGAITPPVVLSDAELEAVR